jgi:hypothetical protein
VEPIPGWTRVIGGVVAVGTGLVAIPMIVLGTASLASTIAQVQRTTTFIVGAAPRLQVDTQVGVAIEAGRDGRIVVEDQRSAGSITRAAAAAALKQMAVDVSRQGDLVVVRQAASPALPTLLERSSLITIQVPAHTDLDVNALGDSRIQGIDGAVHLTSPGTLEVRDSTLQGTSTVSAPVGQVDLTNVTVAGSTTVKTTLGGITFAGRLAPGGSSLDIEDQAGGVSVVLPRPTDARAVIITQSGQFRADGTWLFTPDEVTAPRRWTADLGPNPTGTVTVRTGLGSVEFGSR